MNKEEMKIKYLNEDIEQVIEFLEDYAKMLREEEPHATNTIRKIDDMILELPQSADDL